MSSSKEEHTLLEKYTLTVPESSTGAENAEEEKSGFIAGVVNVMNLMIGGGIIAMAFSASNLGYIQYSIASLIVSLLSLYTVDLLVKSCVKTNLKSYEDLAEESIIKFWPKLKPYTIGRKIVGLCLFITSLACVLAYGFVIKSQLPEIIKTVLNLSDSKCYSNSIWFLNGNIIYLVITVSITLPISMKRNLDFLKWPSMIGMASMILSIFILCIYKFYISCEDLILETRVELLQNNSTILAQNLNQTLIQSLNSQNQCGYEPDKDILGDWEDFTIKLNSIANQSLNDESSQYCQAQPFIFNSSTFDSWSVLFYAWLSHAGILTIYDSLKEQTRENMIKVTGTGYGLCLIMNVAIGLCGYFTWYETTISDILLMYWIRFFCDFRPDAPGRAWLGMTLLSRQVYHAIFDLKSLLYSKTSADSLWILACRTFVNMTVLFSIPMVLFFGRAGFFSVLKRNVDDPPPANKFLYIYNVVLLREVKISS